MPRARTCSTSVSSTIPARRSSARCRARRASARPTSSRFIFNTDLKRRKLRNKVPITYVTSEPYIGHLGLGGVGDSKSMLESEFRNNDIKWICNAKVTKVEAGKMFVTELDEHGAVKKEHELPFKYSMMLPAFKGVDAVAGGGRPVQPARLRAHRRIPAQQEVPQHLLRRRVRGHPAGGSHAGGRLARRRPAT